MSPEDFIKGQIIRGGRGDGVPNALSADNCLVLGERQGTLSKKRMEKLLAREDLDEVTLSRLERNSQMIDLSRVPDEYKEQIIAQFDEEKVTKDSMFNYFVSKKLKLLMQHIGEFKR